MKLETAIKHAKDKLIKRAEEKGLYENFGQNEVRKLKDKYIDCSKYNYEMNHNRTLICNFDKWCMTYTG